MKSSAGSGSDDGARTEDGTSSGSVLGLARFDSGLGDLALGSGVCFGVFNVGWGEGEWGCGVGFLLSRW